MVVVVVGVWIILVGGGGGSGGRGLNDSPEFRGGGQKGERATMLTNHISRLFCFLFLHTIIIIIIANLNSQPITPSLFTAVYRLSYHKSQIFSEH